MSAAASLILDRSAQVAAIDLLARDSGLPTYSEVVLALREQEARLTGLHAALRAQTEHSAAAQVCLLHTGLDQPRETLERALDEALERASIATETGNLALYVAEMRVDLDGRTDVIVLAEARERLRRRA